MCHYNSYFPSFLYFILLYFLSLPLFVIIFSFPLEIFTLLVSSDDMASASGFCTSFSQHILYTLVSDGAKKTSWWHLELSGMEILCIL